MTASIPPDIRAHRDRAADLQRVLRDAYDVACAAGFAPVSWPVIPAKLAFAVTEIREAQGAAHGDRDPEAWATEVLDFVARVGGVLVGLRGDEWSVRPPDWMAVRVRWTPVEVTLWPLLSLTCDALQAWRAGERNAYRVQYLLERAVALGVAIYEQATGADAVVALRAIVERNRMRPVRHGHVENAGW